MKTKTLKLITKALLVIILATSVLTLSACGRFEYEWEVSSYKEFVEKIEEYNSVHNLYVDTYISFDLDDSEQVSKSLYWAFSMVSPRANSFNKNHGHIYDIHNEGLGIKFLYYIKSGEISNAYKIKCNCTRADFNFTENDKIEILNSECNYYKGSTKSYDLMYEPTFCDDENNVDFYNHVYHYSVYVNDTEVCCIHISSVDEASEEKLAELVQMMQDSLVVINTEKFFIWRNVK